MDAGCAERRPGVQKGAPGRFGYRRARVVAGGAKLEEMDAECVLELPELESDGPWGGDLLDDPADAKARTSGRCGSTRGRGEKELAQFEAAHRFASRAKYNDMWVVVDLASQREEDLVVENIRRALARRYEPFRVARVERHC